MLPVVIAAELLTMRRVLRVFRLARFARKTAHTVAKVGDLLNKKEIAEHNPTTSELIHEPIHGEDIYIMMHALALFNMYRGYNKAGISPTSDQLAQIVSAPFNSPDVLAVAHDPVSKVYAYFDQLFPVLNSAFKIDPKVLSKIRESFKQGQDLKLLFLANGLNEQTNDTLIKATSALGYDPADAVFMAKSVKDGTMGLNTQLSAASKVKNFVPLTLISIWLRSLDNTFIDSASSITHEGADFSFDLQLRHMPMADRYSRRTVRGVSTRAVLPDDVSRVIKQLTALYIGTVYTVTDPEKDEETNKLIAAAEKHAIKQLNLIKT